METVPITATKTASAAVMVELTLVLRCMVLAPCHLVQSAGWRLHDKASRSEVSENPGLYGFVRQGVRIPGGPGVLVFQRSLGVKYMHQQSTGECYFSHELSNLGWPHHS